MSQEQSDENVTGDAHGIHEEQTNTNSSETEKAQEKHHEKRRVTIVDPTVYDNFSRRPLTGSTSPKRDMSSAATDRSRKSKAEKERQSKNEEKIKVYEKESPLGKQVIKRRWSVGAASGGYHLTYTGVAKVSSGQQRKSVDRLSASKPERVPDNKRVVPLEVKQIGGLTHSFQWSAGGSKTHGFMW